MPWSLLTGERRGRGHGSTLRQAIIDKGDTSKRKRSSEADLDERLEDRVEWIYQWRQKQPQVGARPPRPRRSAA